VTGSSIFLDELVPKKPQQAQRSFSNYAGPFARLSRNLLERPLFALLFLAVPLNLLMLFTINLCQLVFRLTMDASGSLPAPSESKERRNVRYWHLADMKTLLKNVCFRAQSRH